MDSGASHYLTSNRNHLINSSPYLGKESMLLGNGKSTSIFHISLRNIGCGKLMFNRNNLYHAPQLVKNLIFVRQMCIDNNISIEYFPNSFYVKELTQRKVLLKEGVDNGLYNFPFQSLIDAIITPIT